MVVIIGAGPAGLATAYYLQRYGVAFKILEQHQVGSSWVRFYDHLHLHSLKHHSALPGLAMPESYPDFPGRQQVYDYLQSYVKHFGFSIQERTKILKVSYNHSWQLETNQGLIEATTLVVATGIFNTPFTPQLKGLETFQGQTLHSQQYKRPTDFLGKRVLVVGVGNSGAEVVVALAKAGVHTDVVVRDGVLMVPYPRSVMAASLRYWLLRKLPRALANVVLAQTQKGFAEIGLPLPEREPLERYPVVGFELEKLVRQQQLRIRPKIQEVSATHVHFVNHTSEAYDTLIFATGFRPTLDFLPESLHRQPRLYKVGFHYPTTEPFLLTIKREVKDVAQKIAKLPQLP
jgi:cation diffusion facilitator CzcD-associated flavoprotein CzcO